METKFFGPGLQLWGGEGAPIGDLTYGFGPALAFDGLYDKASGSCAASGALRSSGWLGKHWSAPRKIGMARVYGSNDYGFSTYGGPHQLTLRGSHDGVTWTQLGTLTVGSNGAKIIAEIQATDQSTAYAYHSVTIAPANQAFLVIAQVRFYTEDNGGPPYVFTAPEAGWYDIELMSGAGGGAGAGANQAGGGGGGGGKGRSLLELAQGEQITFTLPRGGLGGRIGGKGQPDTISGASPILCEAVSNIRGVILQGKSGGGGWPTGQGGPPGCGVGNREQRFGAAGQTANPGNIHGGAGGMGADGGGAEGGGEVGLPNGGGGGAANGNVGGDGAPASARVCGPF